jgi:hypothetical protein
MPSVSQAQQQAAAIAKHHPEKLYKRNRAMLRMSKADLSEFARTKHKGLPENKKQLRKLAELRRKRRRRNGRN